jgi:hypothetical protein
MRLRLKSQIQSPKPERRPKAEIREPAARVAAKSTKSAKEVWNCRFSVNSVPFCGNSRLSKLAPESTERYGRFFGFRASAFGL